jgi:putative ABC transport system permease protein
MFAYDVKLAFQRLKQSPKATLWVELTVAISISATMATFAQLHVLSPDPLPGRNQHLGTVLATRSL